MYKKINLYEPTLFGNEWTYVKDCLDSGWVSSAGHYIEKFENEIAKYVGSKYAVACMNGTSALHISLILSNVNKGDEVIVPTLTFIATINAIKYTGASPIFMDSDNFFNIDCDKTITFLNEHTYYKNGNTYNKNTKKIIKAIIPVHVFGNSADVAHLREICKERNINIVEDCAESLGSFFNATSGKSMHTGKIGKFGCFSFNGNKIITSGGGGMIVTDSQKLAEKAKYLTTQAKDDRIYFKHNMVGYNYRMTNLQAALGLGQMKNLDKILNMKKKIFNYYNDNLKNQNKIKMNQVPYGTISNYWMVSITFRPHKDEIKNETLQALIEYCGNRNIEVRPIWYLNHLQTPYKNSFSYMINNSEELVKTTLNVPCSASIKNEDINYVIDILYSFYNQSDHKFEKN